MEMQLSPDFKEFLALLNSANVKYLVVGGYAVTYYTNPERISGAFGACEVARRAGS